MPDQSFVEIRWIVAVVRRWWWLIIGLGALAAGITFLLISIQPPAYETSVGMLINPSKSANSSQYTDLLAGQQLALTYSQMVKEQPVLEAAIDKLGLETTPSALEKKVGVELIRNTQLIQMTVKDSDPQQTVKIANALADAFAMHVEDVSSRRFAGTIEDAKIQLDELQALLKENQAEVDALRTQQVSKQVALENKRTQLNTLQNDYAALENSYQNLQLALADVTGTVYLVEPVTSRGRNYKGNNISTAVVSIGPPQQESGNVSLMYGQLMLKPAILEGVIKELGLSVTPDQLARQLIVELVPGSRLIRITVEDPDKEKAQLIAQTVISAFMTRVKSLLAAPYSDRLDGLQKQVDETAKAVNATQSEIAAIVADDSRLTADVNRLETTVAEVRSDYRLAQRAYEQAQTNAAEAIDAVVVTEPAKTPIRSSQNRLLYTLLAGIVGIIIGAGIGFLLTYLDDRVKNSAEIRTSLNVPVLGTIGQISRNGNDLVMSAEPTSGTAEDFRVLGNKICFIKQNADIRTLLVTSPAQAEGKSVIVSNLAISLSRMGQRVVVVDADLHLPRLHQLFDLEQANGLTYSLDRGNIDGALKSTAVADLKVVTSGDLPSNPAETLSSSPLVKLLEELKEKSDLVLIDCPPVLAAADTSILAAKVDGVLLVLRAGQSEMKTAREALEALNQVKANLVGVVLNAVPERNGGYYSYYRNAEVKK